MTAIIRRGDNILMISQQGPDDPKPGWSVPSGRVEPGELLHEALQREVLEETGLKITGPGHLAWLSQHDLEHPTWGAFGRRSDSRSPTPGAIRSRTIPMASSNSPNGSHSQRPSSVCAMWDWVR